MLLVIKSCHKSALCCFVVPFGHTFTNNMEHFESPAFFLEEGRCSTFEFGAYLGSCKDPLGQRKRAIKFLQYFGIIPKRETTVKCPECQETMRPWTDVKANVLEWRWKCVKNRSRGCGKTVSPLKGTLLGNAHIPPEKCLKLVICWFLQHRVTEAAEECGVSMETAVDWFQYFREIARVVEGHDCGKIGGDDDIVEVDESKCFKRKYNRGRLLKKEMKDVWITGGISRKTKMAFAKTVPDRTRGTLHPFLVKHIEKGSFVFSDGWAAYGGLEKILNPEEPSSPYFKGFASVNHSKNFVRPEPELIRGLHLDLYGLPRDYLPDVTVEDERKSHARDGQLVAVHTQNVERMWEELKKILRTSRGTDEAIEDYIGEFLYRHNILNPLLTTGRKLEKFLLDICRVYPGAGKAPIKDTRRDIPYPEIEYKCDDEPQPPKPKNKRKRVVEPVEITQDYDITFEDLQETVELSECPSREPTQQTGTSRNRRKENVTHNMYDERVT